MRKEYELCIPMRGTSVATGLDWLLEIKYDGYRLRDQVSTMSDDDDWDFADDEDAKMTIRAAVRYLLKSAAGSDRGDIVVEIIEIVRETAHGLIPDQPEPGDDEPPWA